MKFLLLIILIIMYKNVKIQTDVVLCLVSAEVC